MNDSSKAQEESSELVGKMTFVIRAASETAESKDRWERRAELLADWLLAQWREQRQSKVAPKQG